MDDKQDANFTARGELNGNHRLTAEHVRELRSRYGRRAEAGQRTSMKKLASEYKISLHHCFRILHRKVWQHV